MRMLRDQVTFAYDDTGGDGVPMVLLHGWAMNRGTMQKLLERLRGSHRVVSLDLRGFGESDAPGQAYTMAGHSEDLAFVLDRLGLEPVVVVGHSMGAMVALDFASRYPERVAAAVLLEGMVVASDVVRAALHSMLEQVRKSTYGDFVARLVTHLAGPHLDEAERARLLAVSAACPEHVLVAALEGMIAFDSVAAAARVNCPLLYVGTQTTYADLPRFRELCAGLETGQVVGSGHYFPVEVPAQVAPMIERFIATRVG